MALAVDAVSSSSGTVPYGTGAPYKITFSHTCSGTNRVLVVEVSSSSLYPTGVTYAGAAMTLAKNQANSIYYTYIYYLINPATGANNIVVTFNTWNNPYAIGGISFTGADQTTQPEATASGTGNSTSGYTGSITTGVDGCYVIDACATSGTGSSGFAAKTGQTELVKNGQILGGSYKAAASAGSQNMGWNWNSSIFSNPYAYSIISIQPLAAEPETYTKTIQAKARVKYVGVTKTVTVKARITAEVTKTIITKTRIKVTREQTVQTKSSIKKTQEQILTAKANIQETFTQTIQAKGNIKVSSIQAIQVKSSIKKSLIQTLTSKGRIQKSFTQTSTAKTRIQITSSQSLTTKGNKKATSSQTVTAKGIIGLAKPRTITAKGSIKKTITKTILTKGRIVKTFSQTIQSKGRINVVSTQTVGTKAGIQKTSSQAINVKSCIQITFIQTTTAKARIQIAEVTQTLTAKARIIVIYIQTIQTKASIKKGFIKTITSKTRIQISRTQTLTTKTRIQISLTQVLTVKARIQISLEQTIDTKADIKTIQVKTVSAKTVVKRTLEQTITTKCRIQVAFKQTVGAKARITTTTAQTIQVKGNTEKTFTQTINAKAEIYISITHTGNLRNLLHPFTLTETKIDGATKKWAATFTAQESKNVTHVEVYFRTVGTVGTVRIGIQTDNSGVPSGTWIGGASNYATTTNPTDNKWQILELPSSVSITQGTVYHIVVEVDSGTFDSTHYLRMRHSTDDVMRWSYDGASDLALTAQYYNGVSWVDQNGTPCFILRYSTGQRRGQAITNAREWEIYDSETSRGVEFANVSDTYTEFDFRIKKLGSPPNNLTYELYNKTDSVSIESGTFLTPEEVTTDYEWYYKTFSSERTLIPGKVYQLRLTTTGGDVNNEYLVGGNETYDGPTPGNPLVFVAGFLGTDAKHIWGDDFSASVGYLDLAVQLWIPPAIYNQTIQAKTIISILVLQTITAKANLYQGVKQTTTSKAVIKKTLIQTINAKASLVETKSQNIVAKANVKTSINQTISTKARIICIAKTILITPEQLASVAIPVYLVWEIPSCCRNRNIHAHVQVDKTDNTFNDLEKDLYSFRDSDFEYWDGGSWQTYPTSGVGSTYYGNQARVQVTLTLGTKYWRVRGGVK